MVNIELHIDELVLHGFSPGDRFRIAGAVKQELIRLFTEQGLPSSLTRGGEFTRLDSGAFNVAPNPRAEVIGTQVAHSVYSGFAK